LVLAFSNASSISGAATVRMDKDTSSGQMFGGGGAAECAVWSAGFQVREY
jgi:hypothetical protein